MMAGALPFTSEIAGQNSLERTVAAQKSMRFTVSGQK
jgi:hypothetical protein